MLSNPPEIRLLSAEDATAFQVVRLRSLQEHPEAFGSSYEEELNNSLETIAYRLAENPTWGAFVEGELVGIINLSRSPRRKTRHRAVLSGMYIVPHARRLGLGKALIRELLAHARSLDGLEEIVLAVTVGNEAARRLYLDSGFTPYSIEPRYIKVDDKLYDIEWMFLRLVD